MKSILKLLEDMYKKGGDANFFILEDPPYFMQVIGPKKSLEMFVDIPSNEHLPDDAHITEDQVQQILALGFENDPRGDYSLTLPFGSDKANYQKSKEVIDKVMEIYGMRPNKVAVEINLD